MTKALVASIGGMGTLIAGLLIIWKKGPIAGAAILLVMGVVLIVVTVLSELANRKNHGKKL